MPSAGVDFAPADPGTTGQVMQFRVVKRVGGDSTTPPQFLTLPTIALFGPVTNTRQVTLNEFDSSVVIVKMVDGRIQLASNFNHPGASAFFFWPIVSMLGTLGGDGFSAL